MIRLAQSSGLCRQGSDPRMRLVKAAEDLRRKVFASLPWGVRLGSTLFNLRFAADAATFGRLTYGLFHVYGVNGLPRTPAIPETLRQIDKLPANYGLEFGQKARRVAGKYLSDADQVDEVLSSTALKLVGNRTLDGRLKGMWLYEAENYVLKMVQNQALDLLRSDRVRRHDDLTELLHEPGSWDNLDNLIPEHEQEKIKRELEKAVSPWILPDLPLYFSLLLAGYSNKTIAENQMLPSLRKKPISQQGLASYRNRVKDVLRRHFEIRAEVQL